MLPAARAAPPIWPLLALLLACGGTLPTAGGGTGDPGSVRQDCVDHVNVLRATKGLPSLARWTANESCADGQARSDSETGRPHGAFGACPGSAQNECPGWPTLTGAHGIVPGCLDAMWAEGPGGGHYENMTRSGYTMVACGFYTTPDGSVWAVQDYR